MPSSTLIIFIAIFSVNREFFQIHYFHINSYLPHLAWKKLCTELNHCLFVKIGSLINANDKMGWWMRNGWSSLYFWTLHASIMLTPQVFLSKQIDLKKPFNKITTRRNFLKWLTCMVIIIKIIIIWQYFIVRPNATSTIHESKSFPPKIPYNVVNTFSTIPLFPLVLCSNISAFL